jgi:NADH-quinone oxidoreductase subunit H
MNIFMSIPPMLVQIILGMVCVLSFIGVNALVLVYVERKVAGHIQRRPGPFEVGPHGLLQTFADALKMVGKQLVAPTGADRILFWMAPLISFAPVALCFLPVPFAPGLTVMELDLGLLLILAFAGLNVLGICIAGWSANNKWSLLGAARGVAQSVAYEIPLLLAVLAIALQKGSLDLSAVVADQGNWPWQWNILVQPLAFFIYFICAVAETNRNPFDLPEAESELTAGFHTEYSGMGFGIFMLAEYTNMVIVAAVAAALFLGGWHGPVVPGVWWFLSKVYILVFIMMWIRWTYPRVRFDQLLNLSWKFLIPLAMLNLTFTALAVKL